MAAYDYNDRFSFLAEWFDYEAGYQKHFILNFFPSDSTVEIFDKDLNRLFLKRSACDQVNPRDMFVGNVVLIYGRQIHILDYADEWSKRIVSKDMQHTFALLKPSVFNKMGEIVHAIEDHNFQVSKMRMCYLTQQDIVEFYEGDEKELSLPFIVENMTSGPVVALELVGDDAVTRWQSTMGPDDPLEGRKTHPSSLRAIYGLEKFSNGFYGSHSFQGYEKESKYFFGNTTQFSHKVQLKNATCCVVKPHAVRSGHLGLILQEITDRKFHINALQMFHMTQPDAEEFLEVYRKAVHDFRQLIMSFLDGPCVALEVTGAMDNVHKEFRQFVGPSDVDTARQVRPNTLRAKYGVNKYRNAVHCTDLEEDTELEIEFFFKVLSKAAK